jgi:uncharacterized protein YqeY
VSIQEQLTSDQRAAMKSGDKPTVNVIRQVQTEIAQAKSAPGFSGEVDDDLYRSTIAAYVKRMGKAKAEYEALGERGRDHAGELAFEIEYLSRFLPAQMSEDDTRLLVRRTIDDLGVDDPKMTGRVIGTVMRAADGLDGAVVARIVNQELSG